MISKTRWICVELPMIFRPWHEFDGDWFWWGRAHSTVDEFKSLYRLTVSELRDTNGVHNFIYAFSPDCRFNTEAEIDYVADKVIHTVQQLRDLR